MEIIDGKAVANHLKNQIKAEVESWKSKGIKPPHLAAVMIGENAASKTYVNNKIKACKETGIESSLIHLPEQTTEKSLMDLINDLNHDENVDGFIVQLPLPAHIDENNVIEAIIPDKDVDGFHPVNIGRMAKNIDSVLPATPGGILELIRYYKITTEGKHCVVIGRSNIVGMPMAILMGRKSYPGNCTVTLVHSRTSGIEHYIRQADIVISAIGKARFVKSDMVKKGAVVIDVGINAVPDSTRKSGYRLVGDVDFENVAPLCSFITPVPGGVGPMTVAMLLSNTLKIARKRRNL